MSRIKRPTTTLSTLGSQLVEVCNFGLAGHATWSDSGAAVGFNADSNLELPDLAGMPAENQAVRWYPISGMAVSTK